MLVYDKLWKKLKEQKISNYRLGQNGICQSTIRRLKTNQCVNTETLDKLCTILNCGLDEIVEYIPSPPSK